MISSPLLDESIVPIKFSIVVLPPPEGPLIMTNSPLNANYTKKELLFDWVEFIVSIKTDVF